MILQANFWEKVFTFLSILYSKQFLAKIFFLKGSIFHGAEFRGQDPLGIGKKCSDKVFGNTLEGIFAEKKMKKTNFWWFFIWFKVGKNRKFMKKSKKSSFFEIGICFAVGTTKNSFFMLFRPNFINTSLVFNEFCLREILLKDPEISWFFI